VHEPLTGIRRTRPNHPVDAAAVGAIAVGALAIGVVVIRRLAIRAIVIDHAEFKSLVIVAGRSAGRRRLVQNASSRVPYTPQIRGN
jgi:hypothetical protein